MFRLCAAVLLVLVAAAGLTRWIEASDHKDSALLAADHAADIADVYTFRSPEGGVAAGAASASSTATSRSAWTSLRHAAHSARCASKRSRSSEARAPSAYGAASSDHW